jgi:hypothetical protein
VWPFDHAHRFGVRGKLARLIESNRIAQLVRFAISQPVGKSPAAFDGRCILVGRVAPRSHGALIDGPSLAVSVDEGVMLELAGRASYSA